MQTLGLQRTSTATPLVGDTSNMPLVGGELIGTWMSALLLSPTESVTVRRNVYTVPRIGKILYDLGVWARVGIEMGRDINELTCSMFPHGFTDTSRTSRHTS